MSIEKDLSSKIWKEHLSLSRRLLLLVLNYIPFGMSLALLNILLIPWANLPERFLGCALAMFFFPPLCARLLLSVYPIQLGIIEFLSKDFVKWWAIFNLQMIFNRLPFLEEGLRLIPGLYSFWLRLWGARIGKLTYWGPGLKILDRSFVKIGDDVVFGADVRINSHVVYKNDKGELTLALDDVIIGDRTILGGYSLFTAGTEICSDQSTRAVLCLPPFSRYKDGRRLKESPHEARSAFSENPLQIYL